MSLFRRLLALAVVPLALTACAPTVARFEPVAALLDPPPPALFVAAHPDDVILGAGTQLVEHLAAGQDIHILWLTRAEQSAARNSINGSGVNAWWGVQHDPTHEGYSTLSVEAFGQATVDEAVRAVRVASSGLPGTLTWHEAQLPNNEVTTEDARDAILAVADTINPGGVVRLKCHTWVSQLDLHPDHIAAGEACKNLKADDPTRFGDLRYWIGPYYWNDPDLNLVSEWWDFPGAVGSFTATEIGNRVNAACRTFSAWAPDLGAYAIAYHSVGTTWFPPKTSGAHAFHDMVHG